MQTEQPTDGNLKTRKKRLERVRETSTKLMDFVRLHYDALTEEQKNKLTKMVDQLDERYMRYVDGEEIWESRLIDNVVEVQGVKSRSKELSTFDSVMDSVRDIIAYAISPS